MVTVEIIPARGPPESVAGKLLAPAQGWLLGYPFFGTDGIFIARRWKKRLIGSLFSGVWPAKRR
jgi:hypothetical protein